MGAVPEHSRELAEAFLQMSLAEPPLRRAWTVSIYGRTPAATTITGIPFKTWWRQGDNIKGRRTMQGREVLSMTVIQSWWLHGISMLRNRKAPERRATTFTVCLWGIPKASRRWLRETGCWTSCAPSSTKLRTETSIYRGRRTHSTVQ